MEDINRSEKEENRLRLGGGSTMGEQTSDIHGGIGTRRTIGRVAGSEGDVVSSSGRSSIPITIRGREKE